MLPPPQHAVAADQAVLAGQVQALLATAPGLAFSRAGALANALLRRRMRRASWLALAAREPAEAARLLPAVAGEPWLGDVPFAHALDVASQSVAGEPELSRRLLTASARVNPEAALREVRQYIELADGMAIWEAAALEAPDQVVALETLSRPLLERTGKPELRRLLPLFGLTLPERQKAALNGGDPGIGVAALFGRMVDEGRSHGRRAIGEQVLLRGTGEATLRAKDVAALARVAQTEEEREVVVRLSRERLGTRAEGLLEASPEDVRALLSILVDKGVSPGWMTAALASRAVADLESGSDPVLQAMRASMVVKALPRGRARESAAAALQRQGGELAGLLLARMDARRPEARLFPSQRQLRVEELCPGGVCVERYLFPNDDDGVESFQSFLAGYAGEPRWKIRSTEDYVHLEGSGVNGRRIEVFANIPADLQMPEMQAQKDRIEARQEAVTRALASRNLQPAVLVHRGHEYHFPATRIHLREEVRLVYLGSCRGMQAVEDVVTRSRRAQMIATRGVGTKSVNDPFLKALNQRLLDGGEALDWEAFWRALPRLVVGNEHFEDYVPPHRNEAAIFLAGWYSHATGSR